MLAILLSGCSTQLKWFGAGGVECSWDEIGYKAYYDAQKSAVYSKDDLRSQAERALERIEEEQKNLEFGACSDNDLANFTCQ